MGERKSKKGRIILLVLLFVFIGIPLVSVGLSFLGRITPESVIPDSFAGYVHVPNPIETADRLLAHKSLPDILGEPSLAPLLPIVNELIGKNVFGNKYVRFMGQGALDAALMQQGEILAAWDMGVLSPLLRFLPNVVGRITIPNLYYVQAGKLSRLEYRMEDGTVFFIAPYKNLLIISNNTVLFESVLNGASREGDVVGSTHKSFSLTKTDFDIGLLISSAPFIEMMGESDPAVDMVLTQLKFPGLIELAVSIYPEQLDIAVTLPLSSPNELLNTLLSNNSKTSRILQYFPGTTQYSTSVSLGSFKDILNYALSLAGPDAAKILSTADNSSKFLLRLSIDDLLFSWTGTELAAFGLEGSPFPVFAVEVSDEAKRQEVFEKAFSSLILNENISNVIDGTRIPQIQIPDFLRGIIGAFGINMPSPYYLVQEGFLFISESPENLISVLNAVRRNESLPRTDLWKNISKSSSDQNSFSLFYSLDRSLPFFLKGDTGVLGDILSLYRHGLARLALKDGIVSVTLSVIPSPGQGLSSMQNYPLDMGGRMGNIVYGVMGAKKGESRIFFTGDGHAYSLDPASNTRYELAERGRMYAVPAHGLRIASMNDHAAWVVSESGVVTLVNGNMEPLRGFPLVSGVRISAPPAAYNGKIFLPDRDGAVYTVNANAEISKLEVNFENSLKSPPNFYSAAGRDYMASYQKGFLGELWLTNTDGVPYEGWPVPMMNIAFGSPLVFSERPNTVRLAFITQAGELSVFDVSGNLVQGFPLSLSGVFYVQPEFDGRYLWIISEDGTLYRVSLSGETASQKIPGLRAAEEAHIQAVDIHNDGVPEIFITGEGNNLFAYARDLTALENFPLPVWGRPAFGDFNGDGRIECIGMGLDNKLYRWQF